MKDISSQITEKLSFEGQFALANIQSLSGDVLDRLSVEEKQELEEFTNLRRQKEYAASRLLLKELAARYEIRPEEFVILKDELGQPYGMANGNRFSLSIAHTKELVFCGLTKNKAIGIDLEPTDREVPTNLKNRILHPTENELIAKIETIRLWTIKEAYIKLRGQGLRLNMNKVRVQRDRDDFFVELNNDKRAKICSFQSYSNWLAIAFYQ